MLELLVLRHAKSSWGDPGQADHDRPLNGRGKADAPRMGALLAAEDTVPDLIISSTAKRARQTAKLVAEASGYDGRPVLTDRLYHADVEDCLAVLHSLAGAAERVMIVGHNPGLSELVEDLCEAGEVLPTAALAHIALPIQAWSELDEHTPGRLLSLWRPRELG
jgi:phosphohistidine phosphatase